VVIGSSHSSKRALMHGEVMDEEVVVVVAAAGAAEVSRGIVGLLWSS